MATVPAILVPVDGSDQSMQTIRYLARFLSPQHVHLELFHVATDLPETFFDLNEIERTVAYGAELGEWRRDRRLRLERFLNEAIGVLVDAGFPAGSLSTTVQPRRIGIARDIIERSEQGYAAVVVGRKGHGGLPAFMLGSVAAKLADTVAEVPLAVVGGQPEPHKVLVAFDRSQGIQKGLKRVAPLFSRTIEELLLCHIVRPLAEPHPARASYFSSRDEAHWLDENSRRIVPAMVDAKLYLSRSGFEQKTFGTAILKEKTSRADGLFNEAEFLKFDTIIVGRRGATTVESFVMGRVTRKVLHMAFNKAIWIV